MPLNLIKLKEEEQQRRILEEQKQEEEDEEVVEGSTFDKLKAGVKRLNER